MFEKGVFERGPERRAGGSGCIGRWKTQVRPEKVLEHKVRENLKLLGKYSTSEEEDLFSLGL